MKKKGRISTYILGFLAAALVGGMIYGSFERDRMDPVYDKIEEQVQAAETEDVYKRQNMGRQPVYLRWRTS